MRTISVIIPAYNAAAYLETAIDSALRQTCPPAEVIVVDDGSTDNTGAVARRFGNRIRYIRQENSGPSAARNRGIKEATGDWIAFLDADDFWFPNKLALQSMADGLQCSAVVTFEGAPPVPAVTTEAISPAALTLTRLLKRNRIVTSTVLVPRAALLKAGGFDVRYRGPEDFALWLRLASSGLKIFQTTTPLAGYRIVPGSLSQQAIKMRDQELQIIHEVFEQPDCQLSGMLRAESLAGVHFRAGVAFAEAQEWRAALREVARSTLLWPLGLTEYSQKNALVRLRLLRRILLQACCKKSPDTRS